MTALWYKEGDDRFFLTFLSEDEEGVMTDVTVGVRGRFVLSLSLALPALNSADNASAADFFLWISSSVTLRPSPTSSSRVTVRPFVLSGSEVDDPTSSFFTAFFADDDGRRWFISAPFVETNTESITGVIPITSFVITISLSLSLDDASPFPCQRRDAPRKLSRWQYVYQCVDGCETNDVVRTKRK